MRGSGSAPARTARRSDHSPAQKMARVACASSPVALWRRISRAVVVTALTGQWQRSSPPAAVTSAASRWQTAPKSMIPVPGRCSAAIPVACGSIARTPSASRRRTPGTPLACARRSSSSSAGSSPGVSATISLPIRRTSIAFASQ